MDELEASRDELENKIAVEKLAKPRITEEQLRFFLERFRKMDVTRKSQRKMLIDTFVNAIFLYDDKMVLTYNFHESTETTTFGELQEVLPNGFRGSDMNLATEPETYHPNSFPIGMGSDFFFPSIPMILKTAGREGLLPSAERDHPP